LTAFSFGLSHHREMAPETFDKILVFFLALPLASAALYGYHLYARAHGRPCQRGSAIVASVAIAPTLFIIYAASIILLIIAALGGYPGGVYM
jgi:hypothetical protein